jgi:hypothetical protein
LYPEDDWPGHPSFEKLIFIHISIYLCNPIVYYPCPLKGVLDFQQIYNFELSIK